MAPRRMTVEGTKGKLSCCRWLGRKASPSGRAGRYGIDDSCSGCWMIAWLLGSEETERSLAAEVRKTRFGREWEEDEVMVRSDGRRRRSSVGKGNFERLGLAPRNSSAPDPGASVVLRYALSASPLNAQFRFQCWFCGRGGRRHADVLSRWRHDDSSTVFEVNVGTNGFKAIAHEGVLRKSPILTGEMVKVRATSMTSNGMRTHYIPQSPPIQREGIVSEPATGEASNKRSDPAIT